MKKFYSIMSLLLLSGALFAQMPDPTGIYGERRDSLGASVAVGRQRGSYLAKGKDIRTEVISASGLCKMACCNLAESFENSASVTVGYSDAVTGARQIRLLGQSGIYTQMLDENRPVMRGLSAPFGLNYIPSQWLESIQVSKGVCSVINGVESMTGQINLEHRKPTDEKPLFVQASVMNDTKCDLNVASALQLDPEGRWSTVILAHADANFKPMDHNADGFLDDPMSRCFSFANRWLYQGPSGTQVRWGIRAISDDRNGGQMEGIENPWQTTIQNRSIDGYLKVGVPLNADNTQNVALVSDVCVQNMNSTFGLKPYNATQKSAFLNLLYQNQMLDAHHFTAGLSATADRYDEFYLINDYATILLDAGAFAEYTFRPSDAFHAIVGLREDWYNLEGFRFSPRVTLKWAPGDALVFRANAGRGLRYSTPLVDNIGILSTGKPLRGIVSGKFMQHPLEDSWTFGANLTWYLPWDSEQKSYFSLDYFHSFFTEQMLVDYTSRREYLLDGTVQKRYGINLYPLSGVNGGYSYTNNIQADFSTEPIEGFNITATVRFTDARQSLEGQMSDIKPMTSRYKAVLNLQYATHLNKWIFDFTASANGPCKVWDFMMDDERYLTGYTPTYPLLYAQVTRRFKGFDIYAGGENLTGFVQPDPIIGASAPWSEGFDASCIWGPLMGVKVYAGIRVTIWKTI